MPLKPQQLLEALSHNDLLSEAELKRLSDRFAEQPDASVGEACEELLQRGLLTAYQVQVLVHGRNDPLQLGNYIIFDEIGAGGMGRVYKAYHRRMDRMVALKVIKSETVGSTVATQRFQQEVKMAARLHHPNIVTAYDADESDGVQYLVMEYVEGQDLGSLIRQGGPLPVNRAVDYLLQAAQGLAYAHTNGVIHRDIKPGNLLLDQHGVVKVLDMGLARTLGDANRDAETNGRAELTATGMVFGTVDYISPEQALSARRADGRSDIYSLGCCLHFFLTGRPMYQGETLVEVLMMHREADIPDLHGIRDDVPESLVAIFNRMVAKEPDDRYTSMTDVVHDLRELTLSTQLAQEAPTINTVSPLSSSVSWSGPRAKTIAVDRAQAASRKRLAVMLATVALALVAGVVLVAAFFNRNNTADQGRQQTQSAAPTLAQLVEQVEPAVVRLEVQGSPSSIGSGFLVDAEGTVVTNFHVISGARGIVAKFHDGASTSALGIRAIDKDNDLALLKLQIPASRKVVALQLAEESPRKGEAVFAFGTPLGLSFSASDGIISGVRRGDELRELLSRQAVNLNATEYSPDSLWVQTTAPISSGNSGGPLINARGQVVGVNTMNFNAGQNLNFAISAANVRKLLDSSRGELQPLEKLVEYSAPAAQPAQQPRQLREQKAPGEVHRFTTHKDEVLDVAVSRSGRFLASASKDKTVHLFNLEKLSFIYELKSDIAEAWCVAFSHDEQLLLTGWGPDDSRNLKIYERRIGNQPKVLLEGRETGTRRVTAAFDGRSMATSHDGGIIDLRMMTHVNDVFPLLAHDRAEPCYDAKFTDDGRRLATAGGDGFVYVWSIEDIPAPYTRMQVHNAAVRAITISSDGTYFITASEDKTIKVWSPWHVQDQWELLKQSDTYPAPLTCVAISPDGQWIASGSDDPVVRLWHFQSGEQLEFSGHEGAITQVAFLPQGGLLASSSHDGSIRLWRLPGADQTEGE